MKLAVRNVAAFDVLVVMSSMRDLQKREQISEA